MSSQSQSRPPQTTWLFDDLAIEIIACLYKDKSTLAVCTLVCRSWVHPASQHLFRKVYFHNIRRYRGADPEMTLTTFEDLLQFLKTCPRACNALRKLTLQAFYDFLQGEPTHISLSTLHELLHTLPNLRVLKLGTAGWPLQIHKPDGDASSDFKRLRLDKVVLGNVINTSSEHVLDVFALFSSMGNLHFTPALTAGVDYATLSRSASNRYVDPPKLEIHTLSFKLATCDNLQYTLLHLLKAVLEPKVLRRIENISISRFSDLTELDAFIRQAGGSLQELSVRIHSVNVDAGFQTPLHGQLLGIPALSSCVELSRLTVYIDLWPWQDENRSSNGNSRSFNAALSVIETARPAPSLRELRLVFLLRHNALSVPLAVMTPLNVLARIRELPWDKLDELLLPRGRAPELERIDVKIDKNTPTDREPWLGDEFKQILRSRLSSRVSKLIRYC